MTAGGLRGAEPGQVEVLQAGPLKFVMHRVGKFRSEACGVADFNKDGKLDIVAGPYIYFAPDWKPHQIRTLEGEVDQQGKGYYRDFMNLPLDVDGDGQIDVVNCHWWGTAEWFRNIGFGAQPWPRTIIETSEKINFECGDAWDIDGDGRALEILPHTAATWWYEAGKLPDGTRGIIKHVVSDRARNWGGGVGDLNGDGRPDILRPNAWYEAPVDPRRGHWIEHPLSVGAKDGKSDHTPQILVYDVNGDGLSDIVTSSAHRYGIFWYQQTRDGDTVGFKQHLIDDTWTQAHSLALADLDGDGDLDLVTGKRFMAHNGADPDAFGPLGVYWYELKRGPQPQWIKHPISFNQGIGSGMNIPVVDLDGDGDLDIVVTGKWGGPVWFENKGT
ncbi:MAG: FG-GAP repeat domain-containing protein [Thermoguttaceae bacterium]